MYCSDVRIKEAVADSDEVLKLLVSVNASFHAFNVAISSRFDRL